MTYLEKFKQEHPEESIMPDGLPIFCPHAYWPEHEYDDRINELCCGRNTHNPVCSECWNREIPGTEPVNKTENNEREEKKMENTVPAIYSTRKTKAQLLEEIADLKKELAQMERYKQYEECAGEMAAMRESFEKAGFTREEAFEMVKLMIENAVKMARV